MQSLVTRLVDTTESLADFGARPADAAAARAAKSLRLARSSLRRLAANGTTQFRMDLRPDGSAELWLGGQPLELTAKLAQLLALLVEDTGPTADGLVGWKPCAVIASRLAERDGSAQSGALRQNLYRLRRALRDADENPFLVQTKPRCARFALQRRGPGEPPPVSTTRR